MKINFVHVVHIAVQLDKNFDPCTDFLKAFRMYCKHGNIFMVIDPSNIERRYQNLL